ncbi:Hypothetical protein AKI40_3716 [Enterobacter sp. FY-07]|nr:Hypothetical protein AKI40_3716 [Enterobacter sp. FY-07]
MFYQENAAKNSAKNYGFSLKKAFEIRGLTRKGVRNT